MNVHVEMMEKALELAEKGKGTCSPNPMVGAVLVKNNQIIGEGFHQKAGLAHAEVNAINNATVDPKGSTLYCTLEPCCHTKKRTPPCAQFLVKKGISKVIIAQLDPNPEVSGKGVKILEQAGIEVISGVLAKEAKELNKVFNKFITTRLPYVHLKWAQTLDGKISTLSGDSKWISSEKARIRVHQLRKDLDGVLIGRNTLNADNPSLNIRMVEKNHPEQDPCRVVIGNPALMDFKANLFNDELSHKTIVLTHIKNLENVDNSEKYFLQEMGVQLIGVPTLENSPELDLTFALKKLGELGITSLLVEGGKGVLSSFINQKMVDEASVFICPKLLGEGISSFGGTNFDLMKSALPLSVKNTEMIENQILLTFGFQGKEN